MEIRRFTGNKKLMEHKKIAFFCSRTTPKAMPMVIEEWVKVIAQGDYCIVCGAQSPMEKYAFSLILQHKIPAILMLATAMPETWNKEIQTALDENRLLAVTHCDENVHSVSARSATDRNRLILETADNVVVGYCNEDGNIARMLEGRDNVVCLLDDSDSTVTPYMDYYEANAKPRRDSNGRKKQQPGKVLNTTNSGFSLCFYGNGSERFLKICEQTDREEYSLKQSALRLAYTELVAFCRVLADVCSRIEKRETINGMPVVRSESGDITFSADYSAVNVSLKITQTKDVGSMGVRCGTIVVSGEDMLPLRDLLHEATVHFND